MEYEEDFVKEDLIEFEIEKKKFKYKPTTAGDENSWMEEYIEIADGIPKQNLSKINECKIRNLMEVPYSKELIESLIKVNKGWGELTNQEKWQLMKKLKPQMLTKIIIEINKIDSPDNELKKN